VTAAGDSETSKVHSTKMQVCKFILERKTTL